MTNRKQLPANYTGLIRGEWQGRVACCMLGKAVERFSMQAGAEALQGCLSAVEALPLRDFIPYDPGQAPELLMKACCKGALKASLPDDDQSQGRKPCNRGCRPGLAVWTSQDLLDTY